jgi:hypothetical protein
MGVRKYRGVNSGSGEGHPVPNQVRVCPGMGLGGLALVIKVRLRNKGIKAKGPERQWKALRNRESPT